MTTITMYAMRGPRQANGIVRWLGFSSPHDVHEAEQYVANDPAQWEALRPVAIIDRHPGLGAGVYYYAVRGTAAACAALARETER